MRLTCAILLTACASASAQGYKDTVEKVERSIAVDFMFEREPEKWSGYVSAVTGEHDTASHILTLQTKHTHGTPMGLLFRARNRVDPKPVGQKPPGAWPMAIRYRFRFPPIDDWRDLNQLHRELAIRSTRRPVPGDGHADQKRRS